MQAVTRFTLGAALASVALASTATAQGWQAMPGSFNNTASSVAAPARPFFDNLSTDGAGCNIGFILSNAAGANADCDAQRPAGWLPFTGTAPSHFYGNGNAASPFWFGAGLYTIEVIYGGETLGDIAGSNGNWGIFGVNGGGDMSLNGDSDLPITFTSTTSWGFFVDIMDGSGGRAYSNIMGRQFALFLGAGSGASIAGNVVNPNEGVQTFYLGLEDKACMQDTGACSAWSDFDNNDIVFRVTAAPEPGTYALVAAGLAGLFGVARRRRRA